MSLKQELQELSHKAGGDYQLLYNIIYAIKKDARELGGQKYTWYNVYKDEHCQNELEEVIQILKTTYNLRVKIQDCQWYDEAWRLYLDWSDDNV